MIQIENVEVWGFEHAIRGMRNPMNSWDKSDSYQNYSVDYEDGAEVRYPYFRIGPADLSLMQKLYRASLEGNFAHRKFLRQIFVSLDITAPLYWWKEFDTYKVGTVSNSCSTMHKIHSKEFTLDDFSHDHLIDCDVKNSGSLQFLESIIERLNKWRNLYLRDKDKVWWWQMIQILPTSYNQRRTITMNYENAITMILQRDGHKLDEWRDFVKELQKLPWLAEITREEEEE